MIDLKRRAVLRSLSAMAGASILAPAAGAANISPLPPVQSDERVAGLAIIARVPDNVSVADMRESAALAAGLNPEFTFDNFVAGKANQQALAVAQLAVNHPESVWNPLLIYGAVGRGKTHLMDAIGHKILERNPQARVLSVHSYTFFYELITSYRDRNRDDFRNRYESLDALLIDKVSFLNGKDRSQEELLWVFDRLEERGSMVVMADTPHPKDWFHNFDRDFLDGRLSFKLARSPAFELGNADFALRLNVLRAKALKESIALNDETARYIAEQVSSGCILELEMALKSVNAYARLHHQDISLRLARRAITDFSLDWLSFPHREVFI